MQPGKCLAFFSAARAVKSFSTSAAAAATCDGRSGHETVTSRAVTYGARWWEVMTMSTFVPLLEEEQRR